jgi:hypothetical protein
MAGKFGLAWRAYYPDAPQPVTEWLFHPERDFRLDYAFLAPDSVITQRKGCKPRGGCGVAVEEDGGQYKGLGGRHNTDSDRWKIAEANGRGWIVFRFSTQMLDDDPERCCELVAKVLRIE